MLIYNILTFILTDRLKKLWDNIHPELNHFNDKNVRDIASRVEKGRHGNRVL